jgi:16S rRNA (guanine966-N2)-methyltransferase
VAVRAEAVSSLLAEPATAAYDVVFLDPPYKDQVDAVLAALVDNGWVAAGGTVVVERASRDPDLVWPAGMQPDRWRRYGEATLWYGRRP